MYLVRKKKAICEYNDVRIKLFVNTTMLRKVTIVSARRISAARHVNWQTLVRITVFVNTTLSPTRKSHVASANRSSAALRVNY